MSAARAPETDGPPVLYERRGPVARVTMSRPRYRNAQNSAMTYALDDAFHRAADDPEVKVVVLAGAGGHFSAGHDIGTPGRDAHLPFERRAGLAGETDRPARRIAEMPGFGLALTKRAVNQAEDLQGLHTGMDSVFGLHHLAHAHNAETAAGPLGGMNVCAMKDAATRGAARDTVTRDAVTKGANG
ncbi:enoyl-CoA hydratase-related protein [Streptomyces sp. NPDC102278]|uniref:enoyl-CoA hydratase-related protein n=1 Tax=Streptomyces sp. NPDC102278 TaxID=3366152 RepID=UPI003825509A